MHPPEYSSWHQPQQETPHTPWPTAGPYQILEGGPAPGRKPPWAWLVAVLAVIFIGAAAAGVILKLMHKVPGHAATPPASSAAATDGRAQAMAIDALLNASSASRNQLGPALAKVDACGDLNAATTMLDQIILDRAGQLEQGKALAVDQIDGGAALRDKLVQALQYSLEADKDFAAWLQSTKTNGCTGQAPHDANYSAAQAASANASANKQSFVQLWNPVAAKYGLPNRAPTSF
jgi:hypothetical protein